MHSATYQIPSNRIAALEKRLTKLCNKALKLCSGIIAYIVGDPQDVPMHKVGTKVTRWSEDNHGPLSECEASGNIVWTQFFPVTLTGNAPSLDGWTFAATIQHLKDEDGKSLNVLRVSPGYDSKLPTLFRTADASNCDHCKKKILTRKDTYVVHKAEVDEWQQVGKTCLADFLGGTDPHAVAGALESLLQAITACTESEDEGEGGYIGGSNELRWGISTFMAQTAACIRVDGWLSRGKARETDGIATADKAIRCLGPATTTNAQQFKADRAITPEDTAQALATLDYIRDTLGAREDLNDYEHNLYVACLQGTTTPRLAGIVASGINFYLRAKTQPAPSTSEHFGEIKARPDFYATLQNVFVREGHFGTQYICRFVTRKGNAATWFTSTKPTMVEGQEYLIAATITNHEIYKGTKTTIINRVKVYNDVERAKREAKWAQVKAAPVATA